MWARLCTGLLVLAMVASGTTASHAHLHTGNGHRVSHDDDHVRDQARSLWHAHRAPHAHDADVPVHEPGATSPGDAGEDEPLEDVVSVGDTVASSPTPDHWTSPVLVATVMGTDAFDVPLQAWTAAAGALPPIHAPPLIAPRSPRAPPTFAHLHV